MKDNGVGPLLHVAIKQYNSCTSIKHEVAWMELQ